MYHTKLTNMKIATFCLSIVSILSAETYRPNLAIPDCYPPVYNAPANVDLCSGWNVFATGSAIYWHASQDYMDAGRTAEFSLISGSIPSPQSATVYPDFSYNPGFKVGLGLDTGFDYWTAQFQYTWYHHEMNHSTGAVPSSLGTGTKIYLINDWFNSLTTSSPPQEILQIQNEWKLHLDQLDLLFTNPLYGDNKGILYHYCGFRSLFIRQSYDIEAVSVDAALPVSSHNHSQSWSFGPQVGIGAHGLYKWGARVEGNMKFSLLYTRYTKLYHSENDQGVGDVSPIAGSMAPYGCLRPNSEFGVGLGWGSYFADNRLHFDLAARYDFMIIWNQNMMRQNVASLQDNNVGYADAAGNLYLHGLTVDLCFNF